MTGTPERPKGLVVLTCTAAPIAPSTPIAGGTGWWLTSHGPSPQPAWSQSAPIREGWGDPTCAQSYALGL